MQLVFFYLYFFSSNEPFLLQITPKTKSITMNITGHFY